MNAKIISAMDALTQALTQSDVYKTYAEARTLAFQSPYIRTMYQHYRQLQLRVQVNDISGEQNAALQEELRHISGLLYFNEHASAFLLAEYSLNSLLQEIYQKLAQAVGEELPFLDS